MGQKKGKWYFNPWTITAAILCVGPLGLLPLWFRPKTSVLIKAGVSALVVAATVWLFVATVEIVNNVAESYRQLAALY
ncbi:MAG: hypothetical protein KKC50_04905 [Candidatus Omnitrophica bacterium]|nr:hypothetical protein [Candidatus Omnitrophota bacterium]